MIGEPLGGGNARKAGEAVIQCVVLQFCKSLAAMVCEAESVSRLLLRYIARSALCISVSVVVPLSGKMATPMLAVTSTFPLPVCTGLLRASASRSAKIAGCRALIISGNKIANSSPPIRQAVSVSRMRLHNLPATCCNRASPAQCALWRLAAVAPSSCTPRGWRSGRGTGGGRFRCLVPPLPPSRLRRGAP